MESLPISFGVGGAVDSSNQPFRFSHNWQVSRIKRSSIIIRDARPAPALGEMAAAPAPKIALPGPAPSLIVAPPSPKDFAPCPPRPTQEIVLLPRPTLKQKSLPRVSLVKLKLYYSYNLNGNLCGRGNLSFYDLLGPSVSHLIIEGLNFV